MKIARTDSRRRRRRFQNVSKMAALACLFGMTCEPVIAQNYRNYYSVQNADKFKIDRPGFYKAIEQKSIAVRSVTPHQLDIPYGAHERNRLDLYLPKGKVHGAPVFLFIHGGGFREGDRDIYGYVAAPFSAHGYITVVPSYRLTTEGFHYPSQPKDMQQALAWIYRNIARFGGDPDRIYVGGHSVGGILTSDLCVRGDWLKANALPHDLIKGCASISGSIPVGDPKAAIGGGVYKVRKAEGNAYDPDAAHRRDANPLLNINMAPPRALYAVGSEEPQYHQSARTFVRELTARGTKAEILVLDGLSHADTAIVLADDQSLLFKAVLKTFDGAARPQP